MRRQGPDEQDDRCNQSNRGNRANENAENTIERAFSSAMTYHRGYKQDDNQCRQQPSRTNDKRTWECQINAGDRQEREQRLPAWLRFIEVMRCVGHDSAIAKITSCANSALLFGVGSTLPALRPPEAGLPRDRQ